MLSYRDKKEGERDSVYTAGVWLEGDKKDRLQDRMIIKRSSYKSQDLKEVVKER